MTAGSENQFDLEHALKFGLIFSVVPLASRAAQVYLDDAGLYLTGAMVGLTDVDATALSLP